MAQTGFTPILIYGSATPGNTPSASNLTSTTNGVELALNYADGKLYYKDSGGTVQVLAAKGGNGVTTFSGGTTGLTPSSATAGAITLSGTLAVANGGTGVTTSTGSGSNVLSNSPTLVTPALGTPSALTLTNATGLPVTGISATGTPSSSTYLRGDGSWQTISTGGVTSFQTSLSGLTPSTATTGVVTLAGTLGAASGGTGLTSYTANGLVYASGATTIAQTPAPTTANTYLNWNGTAFAWGSVATTTTTSTYLQQSALFVSSARTTVTAPDMVVGIGGSIYSLASSVISINTSANWDSATYATAANRAGLDFYVYALTTGSYILSNNSTVPTGYTASNSRKVGGFHCLCSNVGTITGHTLSGYVAGDILPLSVWDRYNRSRGRQAGTIKSASGKWVDIYLPSWTGSSLASTYGATVANGGTSPAFHCYKFEQVFATQNMRTIRQNEFVATSLGSNQSTNITGSAQKTTTGGSTDTAGRRMISNEGVEDCCGSYWQWCADIGANMNGAAFANAYDGNDIGGVAGQAYQDPYRGLLGGAWADGVNCGSRGSFWDISPLSLNSYVSARGVAEPQVYVF